jgi:hypothetical protein
MPSVCLQMLLEQAIPIDCLGATSSGRSNSQAQECALHAFNALVASLPSTPPLGRLSTTGGRSAVCFWANGSRAFINWLLDGVNGPLSHYISGETPLFCEMVFTQPTSLAAPYDTAKLLDHEFTSWKFALIISEACMLSNSRAITHLLRHYKYLAGQQCTLTNLDQYQNDKIGWQAVSGEPDPCYQLDPQLQQLSAQAWLDFGLHPWHARVHCVKAPLSHHGAGSHSLPPLLEHGGEFQRLNGILACYSRGGNAITKLGPSFFASSVLSLLPIMEHGGES